jgi:hypothetical protein
MPTALSGFVPQPVSKASLIPSLSSSVSTWFTWPSQSVSVTDADWPADSERPPTVIEELLPALLLAL